jgi:hypothetical protein
MTSNSRSRCAAASACGDWSFSTASRSRRTRRKAPAGFAGDISWKARPLRRVPLAARRRRRDRRGQALLRRAGLRRAWLRPEHHPGRDRHRLLVRARVDRLSRHRPDAHQFAVGRLDGGGHRQFGQTVAEDRAGIAEYIKSLPGVDAPNQGMPEPNRSALIQMLPQGADKSRQSKLDALSVMPAGQLDKATILYVVDTKSLYMDQPQAGANSVDDGKVLAATKLTVLARSKDLLQVRIDGWQQEGSESALYALQGQRIVEALLSPAEAQKVVKGKTVHDAETNLNWNQGTLTAWVRADRVSTDLERLWTYSDDLFGASCATCHALPQSGSYLANQWIGNLGSMKRYASLDDDQYRLMLTYLQYHSKDVNTLAVVAKP